MINLVISVGPKCPFPFYKIVVPSTALLYPSYESNNQTRGGLACRVCATEMYRSIGPVKFPKFQTEVLAEWKAPLGFGIQNNAQGTRSSTNNWIIQVTWNPESTAWNWNPESNTVLDSVIWSDLWQICTYRSIRLTRTLIDIDGVVIKFARLKSTHPALCL